MTSAVTRKAQARSAVWQGREAQRAGPFVRPSRRAFGRRRAFTLVELILAVMIFVALVAAVTLNLSAWGESRRLEEGARRFEALLLMTRAEAANLGRKLRISFQSDEVSPAAQIHLLWEANPLEAPQQFTEYTACTWLHHLPVGLVEVKRSELLGEAAYRLMASRRMHEEGSADGLLAPVTFYPDGSCDSAVIELVSAGEADDRLAVIEIEGLTGTIRSRILTPSEYEQETE